MGRNIFGIAKLVAAKVYGRGDFFCFLIFLCCFLLAFLSYPLVFIFALVAFTICSMVIVKVFLS